MKVKYSGRVYYANGEPVPNVIVHIYDKDAAGKQDDDLTVSPGLSDEQGNFHLTYEPLRYIDYHTVIPPDTPDEPFNTSTSGSGLRLPDLGDIYLPYLKFDYTFNGLIRAHTTPLGIFQKKFYLPVNPPVEFLPSNQGFKFVNTFPGYFLPFSTPAFMGSRKVSSKYGLCGGMCAVVYDFVLSGKAIPSTAEAPHPGTRLHRYLFQRQIDSLGGLGQQAVKVAQWTSLPDDTLLGTQARTLAEFNSIRQKLDDKNLVILALIYEHATSLAELTRQIFNNHQVLAFACHQDSAGRYNIQVYDPNLPARDDVIIRCDPVVLGEVNSPSGSRIAMGLKSAQLVGGDIYKHVRGFFAMPYEPVIPPKRI